MDRLLTFAYPGDLDTLTGGYLYDKNIILALERQGWTVHRLSLEGHFPNPDDATLKQAARQLARVDPSSHLIIDGLALGAMGELARIFEHREGADRARHGFVALVHHPLALESGIDSQLAQKLRLSEGLALQCAERIIVTSPTTATAVQAMFDVPLERICVVVPGTDRPQLQAQQTKAALISPERKTPVLLSVGAVIPRKGYDVLIDALASLKDLAWELRIVGDQERDKKTAQQLCLQILNEGLCDRVNLLGNVQPLALNQQYEQADVFVLASHYEGYGMAYAEAMLWGLPVIGTNGGAIAETVSADGSILVSPGDAQGLRQALKKVLTQPALRQQMSDAACAHAQSLPDWGDSARLFGRALLKTDKQ